MRKHYRTLSACQPPLGTLLLTSKSCLSSALHAAAIDVLMQACAVDMMMQVHVSRFS